MTFILLVGFIIFIFGASIGSFIAAMAYRLHKKKRVCTGRSQCPSCKSKLRFFELFPIFSFIFLGGKCKKCKASISTSDFFIEIACGVLFTFTFFYRCIDAWDVDIFSITILRDWLFLGGMIFLFVYDYRHKILPDKITIPLAIALFLFNFILGDNIWHLFLAVIIGGGFFLLQWIISRGKWIGDGDIRMGAVLGAGLGFPNILLAIFLAYIFGAIVSVILLLKKKVDMKSEIAFGTFLAVSGTLVLFFGNYIVNWYLSLML